MNGNPYFNGPEGHHGQPHGPHHHSRQHHDPEDMRSGSGEGPDPDGAGSPRGHGHGHGARGFGGGGFGGFGPGVGGFGPGGFGPGSGGPGPGADFGGFGPGGRGRGRGGFGGFGGGGWSGARRPPFGRGGRVRKGNVRSAILSLLSQSSNNGYGIIKDIAEHTDGAWRPSPGSVYPALAALQAEGLIGTNGEGRRTEFELTEQGRAYVTEHAAEMAAVWEEVNEEAGAGLELRTSIGKLMGAVHQISADGTEDQLRIVTATLDEARRTIYKLLSD
jgi:DNA-binding PadR family transcriptional regulator